MKYFNLIFGIISIVIACVCAYKKEWSGFWPYLVIGVAHIEIYQLKCDKK